MFRFAKLKDLENFLKHHSLGKEFLYKIMAEEFPYFLASEQGQKAVESIERAIQSPKVLHVIYGDGYTEVYSSSRINLRIAKVPSLPMKDMPVEKIEDCECAAKMRLPKHWRQMWERSGVANTYNSTPLKPSEFIRQERGRVALRWLKSIEKESRLTTLASEGVPSASER